jgi:hypothetical protein
VLSNNDIPIIDENIFFILPSKTKKLDDLEAKKCCLYFLL